MSNLNIIPQTGRFGDAVDAINANFTLLDEQMSHFYDAYQVWLQNGNTGTVDDFLQSLTAYGIAVENGYVGTEEEWLASLKGADGVVLDPEAVTIFDSLADLDGKTTAEKEAMIPDGNLIDELEEKSYLEDLVNLTQFSVKNCSCGDTNWYMSGSKGRHKAIPVEAGDKLRIVSDGYFGWLTSSYNPSTEPTNGTLVPYVSGTSRRRPIGSNEVITAPQGAAYLCITIVDGGGNTISNTLYYEKTLKQGIDDIEEEIAEIRDSELAVYKVFNVDILNGDGSTIVMQEHVSVEPNKEYAVRVMPMTWEIPDPTASNTAFGIYEYNATSAASINIPVVITQNNFTNLDKQYNILTTSSTRRMRVQFRATAGTQIKVVFLEKMPKDAVEDAIGNSFARTTNVVHYEGNQVSLKNTFQWMKFGNNILYGKYQNCASQSVAIYDGYLFQLFDTGYVVVFSIDSEDIVKELGSFRLACANVSPSIHCNAAQFAPTQASGQLFPYLYVADGLNKRVFVEQINESEGVYSSTTLQVISHDDSEPFNKGLCSNFIIGYDGNLWIQLADTSIQRYVFYKLTCPAVSSGDTTLTDTDILQVVNGGAISSQYTLQSMCVIGGRLLNLFGSSGGKHRVDILDTITGMLVNSIPLDDIMTGECEGIYIYNGKMYITMYNLNYGFVLDFD